jgi:pyruvate/2-oxoglutarate dehydrogenase complex dihydrolipoamide dehydrogenase (E3) component
MKNYEAIIIGGGGGLKLRPITDSGKKIAIIEKGSFRIR